MHHNTTSNSSYVQTYLAIKLDCDCEERDGSLSQSLTGGGKSHPAKLPISWTHSHSGLADSQSPFWIYESDLCSVSGKYPRWPLMLTHLTGKICLSLSWSKSIGLWRSQECAWHANGWGTVWISFHCIRPCVCVKILVYFFRFLLSVCEHKWTQYLWTRSICPSECVLAGR